MKKNNKKVVSKVETKTKTIVDKNPMSISKMTFAFITKNKIITSDNKKSFFGKLKSEILEKYPNSHFNENHYYWYIAKYKKQAKLGLGLDCLKQVKKIEDKEINQFDSKVSNKKEVKTSSKCSERIGKKYNVKKSKEIETCPDCGVKVGQFHKEGCDWARCGNCDDQLLSCDCGKPKNTRFEGGAGY